MCPKNVEKSSRARLIVLAVFVTTFQLGCQPTVPTQPTKSVSSKTKSADAQSFRWQKAQPGSAGAAATITSEIKTADSLGLKPFIYFSASWCPPCNAIKSSMDDQRMKDAFSGTYIIEFDIDKWPRLPAGFDASAVPVYYEIDSAGRPTGRRIDGGAWGANDPANMAPPLEKFFHAK